MLGYKISGFFYFSLPLFLFVVFPILAHAKCAITFKDGKKSESEYCEMVGNKFIYYKYGSEIEIDSSKVDHFEFAPDESINNIADDAKVSNGNNSNIDIIEKIKNKYGVDYGRSSFIRESHYRFFVAKKLTMKERFLYVEALIDESQNNYNSKQKKLDYSIAMNDEKEFFNNRVHVRKAKLRLIRTEGALGCLIKYTEEDQDIVGKSIIDSRYSESEIEYYKNSPKRYKEYSINSIQKMLDDTTLRLEMCEDNPTCSKRRRDRLRSMIGSMKKEQTVSLESPCPGCILGGQPIIYLNFP